MTMKSEARHAAVGVMEREAGPLESFRAEASYRRERLALYKARMYAGRARGPKRLNELQRSSDGAAERLRLEREKVAAEPTGTRAFRSSREAERDG